MSRSIQRCLTLFDTSRNLRTPMNTSGVYKCPDFCMPLYKHLWTHTFCAKVSRHVQRFLYVHEMSGNYLIPLETFEHLWTLLVLKCPETMDISRHLLAHTFCVQRCLDLGKFRGV